MWKIIPGATFIPEFRVWPTLHSYFWGPVQSGGDEKNKNNIIPSICWSRNNLDQLVGWPHKTSNTYLYILKIPMPNFRHKGIKCHLVVVVFDSVFLLIIYFTLPILWIVIIWQKLLVNLGYFKLYSSLLLHVCIFYIVGKWWLISFTPTKLIIGAPDLKAMLIYLKVFLVWHFKNKILFWGFKAFLGSLLFQFHNHIVNLV